AVTSGLLLLSSLAYVSAFLLSGSAPRRERHSFPTRRSSDLEGAAMIRSKGEAGTGDVSNAVTHMRTIRAEINRLTSMAPDELYRSEETRLNSSHVSISYAVFCLKKKKKQKIKAVTAISIMPF